MDVDAKEGEPPKKKRIVRKREVPIVFGSSSFDASVVNTLREAENSMHTADKLVKDTEDRKNALEEYIYDMRSKLDDRYAAYVIAHDKEQLLALLIHAEDWLYSEEGEDATKSAYTEKLDSLKALGDPIVFRWQEHQELPRTAGLLRDAINQYMSQATSGEERYSHIEPEKLQSVVEKAATIHKWLEDQLARQAEKAKTQPPVVTTEEIKKKREELVYFATPILTKPKPKPAPETTGPPPPKEEEPKQDSATPTPPPESGPAEPSNMDVD